MASRLSALVASSCFRMSLFSRAFSSVVKKDMLYAETHEWAKVEGGCATVGITDHAQDHLGDVVYVELPGVGDEVKQGTSFGAVESVKATSDVNSPLTGKVLQINEQLNTSPGLVNGSPYDKGWIMKVEMGDPDEVKKLMNPDQYSKFCDEEDEEEEEEDSGSDH